VSAIKCFYLVVVVLVLYSPNTNRYITDTCKLTIVLNIFGRLPERH